MKVLESDPIKYQRGVSGKVVLQLLSGEVKGMEDDHHEQGVHGNGNKSAHTGRVVDPPGGQGIPGKKSRISIEKDTEFGELLLLFRNPFFDQ